MTTIGPVSDPRWREHAACRDHPLELWFPTLGAGRDNHGTAGKTICQTCPVRQPCLETSLIENQQFGLAGGAGEDERRWLRRAWHRDGPDGPVWRSAALEHFARLDGAKMPPVDRNGPQATHGRAVTYSRACRCPQCEFAASMRGAGAKRDLPWRYAA